MLNDHLHAITLMIYYDGRHDDQNITMMPLCYINMHHIIIRGELLIRITQTMRLWRALCRSAKLKNLMDLN